MMTTPKCYICKGAMTPVRQDTELKIGVRTVVVPVEGTQCADCGEIFHSPDQMEAAQLTAAAQIRTSEGLLTPSEIKSIRSAADLTQSQMETLLGVGPKTVVRWERGTVVQSRAIDQLLTLIRDVPEAYYYLASKSGIAIQTQRAGESRPLQVSTFRPKHRPVEPHREVGPGNRVAHMEEFRARNAHMKRINPTRMKALPTISAESMR